jgi:hypothetical protein
MSDYEYDFFISYRRDASRTFASRINYILKKELKYKVFFDRNELKDSSDWRKRINDNIPKSRIIIVFLGAGAFDQERSSDHFLHELQVACKCDLGLIPVEHGNFTKNNETKKIPDKKVLEWIDRPTALNLDEIFKETDKYSDEREKEDRDFILRLLGRLSRGLKNADGLSEYDYLSRIKYKESCGNLKRYARECKENDGKIDYKEATEIRKKGEEWYLCEKTIFGIIDEVDKAPSSQRQGSNTQKTLVSNTSTPLNASAVANALKVSQLSTRLSSELGEEVCNLVREKLNVISKTGKLSSRILNAVLSENGYQIKNADGFWQLTSSGQPYGAEASFPGPRGTQTIQVRWFDNIIPKLSEILRKTADVTTPPEPVDDIDFDDLLSPSDLAAELSETLGEEGSNSLREHLGVNSKTGKISARMVNSLLETAEFLQKTSAGWLLTETGDAFGVENVWEKEGRESSSVIRWKPTVTDTLLEFIDNEYGCLSSVDSESDDDIDDEDEDEDEDWYEDDDVNYELYDQVGKCYAKDALKDKEYVDLIAEAVGLTSATIKRRLKSSAKNAKVSDVFDCWYDLDHIGGKTASGALYYLSMISVIAEITGISCKDVSQRLSSVHGNKRVSTVFCDEW